MFPIKNHVTFLALLLSYIVFSVNRVFYASAETWKIKKESTQIAH